jgi:hypothetical protein
VGSLTSSQPSSGLNLMVSLPHGLSFSLSAVRNHRAASHCARHSCSVSPAAPRLARLRSRPRPPRVTGTAPAASRRSTRARRAFSDRSRMSLACRSAGVAYPRVRPVLPATGTVSRASILATRARRLACSACRFCPASRTWFSLVRVIAPAQRDDDSPVSARLRHARDAAFPLASSRPSAHRAARSRPANIPRCRPAPAAPPRPAVRPAAWYGPVPRPGSRRERGSDPP